MEYEIYAYYDNRPIAYIAYPIIRYYQDNTIFHLFDCLDILNGGDKFINYMDIERARNDSKINDKEKHFLEALNGYDMIELRMIHHILYE